MMLFEKLVKPSVHWLITYNEALSVLTLSHEGAPKIRFAVKLDVELRRNLIERK